MSKVLSSAAAEQGAYIFLSILSVLYSNALHAGIMRAHVQNASDSGGTETCSESKAIVENGFEKM